MQEIELQSVEKSDGQGEPVVVRNMDYLQDVDVQLEARIGKIDITVKELFNLKAGAVLSLIEEADEPLDLILKGNVIARGRLVVVGDHFGVEISEVN